MIRIRGKVGRQPIELDIELDGDELAALRSLVVPDVSGPSEPASEEPAQAAVATPASHGRLEMALALLEKSGSLTGPRLLEELAALCGGNAQGAKRLLVRLRHAPEVRVETRAEVPVFHWQPAGPAD